MVQRISSMDGGYQVGDLSVYPEARDNKTTLYEAKNLAQTVLKQSLTYTSKIVVVDDASAFSANGLLRIGPPAGQPGDAELIYYDKKAANTFQDLLRGFAGSRQSQWPAGSHVTSGVMAEHHNAVKDAILRIERNLGKRDFPNPLSLNGILKEQEVRFLAPKPLFRAFPIKGPPPLRVRFQNFSTGNPLRHLWDFGDGTTSVEKSPIHTYLKEGIYTVKLNLITSTGAQGVVTKNNYIVVSKDEKQPFFYVVPSEGDSVERAAAKTAAGTPSSPTVFTFVDQTDGAITQRYWIFDDGTTQAVEDPDIHTVTHTYQKKGSYEPSLLVIFANQSLKRAFLVDKITVF